MQMAIENVHKKFGDLYVLKELSMMISKQKVVSILGPSGCGKSTLLNILSGLIKPDTGKLDGFKGQTISYLFQEPRLLKWKTVRGNIEFVLKDVMNDVQRVETANKYIDMVGLREFADYYPGQLSGGMKQRVATARAFAYPAGILLMDEPFKSLDLQLKTSLMDSFLSLWLLERRTVFFVTHDIQEALLLGCEVYILTDKPARVKSRLTNNIPLVERKSENGELAKLEKDVREILFDK